MRYKNLSQKFLILTEMLVTLSGCSHNIQLTPSLEELRQVENNGVSNKNVAYYISAENRVKQVTTPGGGGDKVTYKPYADSEAALNTILLKAFSKVYSINSITDKQTISEKSISFIFVPKLITNSSSSSPFTWPPTEFTISLSCEALNKDGDVVWTKAINSKGNAEFSEFKSDHSLAARRATAEAFTALLDEINKEDIFK
jgi:hypothetical protein